MNKNSTMKQEHITFNEVNLNQKQLDQILIALSKKQLSKKQFKQLLSNSNEVIIKQLTNN